MRAVTQLLALAVLLTLPHLAMAQSPPQQPPPATPAAAPAQNADDQLLKPEQLDALVAPIALYPDPLLSEIFMASTYPLEVIEADRWMKANASLKGDALKAAVGKQGWDDSVKSLVATPSVLDMMSDKLDWTQALGNAILAQQADVMDAVQRLRAKAQANNKLMSTSQQTVTTQPQASGPPAIVIQPTQPDTIYVPYYDPAVVYGAWPYPAYPPYYWPAPGYIAGGIIAGGIAFGAGYALGRWAGGGGYWGGGFGWGGGGHNNIYVNRNVNINNIGNNNNWSHNPAHRQGVRYNNTNVANKFGGNRGAAGGAQGRMDFRGHNGQGLGGGNVGAGNRPGGGGNVGAGNRPGGGGNVGGGNRPGGAGAGRPGNAMGNVGSGRTAAAEGARGRSSLGGGGGGGGGFHGGGGGGGRGGGGGGGFHGGGGGGGGGRGGGGGGRRSDIRLKHDIVMLGRLDNGIGVYRFVYNGDDKIYVGVMAQDVEAVMPEAVTRGRDGYLRVYYDKVGFKFQSYGAWLASGARIPAASGLIAQ